MIYIILLLNSVCEFRENTMYMWIEASQKGKKQKNYQTAYISVICDGHVKKMYTVALSDMAIVIFNEYW